MNVTTVWMINLGFVALIFIAGWVFPKVTGYGRFYDKMMTGKGDSTISSTRESEAENKEEMIHPE